MSNKIILPPDAAFNIKYENHIPSEIEFVSGEKGDVSDGYHSFNDLYRHRYALFLLAALHRGKHAWCSKQHHDGTMFEDSFIVGMELATGTITYHLPLREWDRASRVLTVLDRAPEWDGASPEDVVDRINRTVDMHS